MRAELELCKMTGSDYTHCFIFFMFHSRGETKITITLSLSNGTLFSFRFGVWKNLIWSWISSWDFYKNFPAILAWPGLAGPGISRLRGDQSDSGLSSPRLPILRVDL